MRIIVDADATPGISLIEMVAQKYQIPCILISDDTHILKSEYSDIITVTKGFQSVDIYLVNMIEKGDIVVTQDYGVACVAISKKIQVVNPKGEIYSENNIDLLMTQRHIHSKLRHQKKHIKGPKKRTKIDDERLVQSLTICIEKEKR